MGNHNKNGGGRSEAVLYFFFLFGFSVSMRFDVRKGKKILQESQNIFKEETPTTKNRFK